MDTHKGRTARSGRLLAQSISPLLKTPFEQQPVYKASIELPLPNCSSNAVLLNKFDEYFGKASGLPRETKTMFQSSRTVQ